MNKSNMRRPHSEKYIDNVIALILLLGFLAFVVWLQFWEQGKEQKKGNILSSIRFEDVASFKILPYGKVEAADFTSNQSMVGAFFYAFSDRGAYKPQHDQAIEQWGVQIDTSAATMEIRCYIPDINLEVVVGRVETNAGQVYFQSHSLLRWYQRYGHYWGIGDYQRMQHRRVKSDLMSIAPPQLGSFSISVDGFKPSEKSVKQKFMKETALVTEFFQGIQDIQFAAPTDKNFFAQWNIGIRIGADFITVECSIPVDDPTLVIGLVDSPAGYGYFQSRQLYQWYQKHSHRWLEPEGTQPNPAP